MRTSEVQTIYKWTCDQDGTQLNTVQSGVPDGWAHVKVNGNELDLCPTCAGPYKPAWDNTQAVIAAKQP